MTAKNTNCFFDEIKKQKKLIMTNPRHPNPIHENRLFSWTKRQNPNLIHENQSFPWAERRRCEEMLGTCAATKM